MALKVPNVGEEVMLDLILGEGYTLKLFKSNTTPGDTDTAATYTEADFTGYSSKALTGGSWSTTPANPSTGSYSQQSFTSTADQTPQIIYGYYVIRTTGGTLMWAERFSSPITVQYNNDSIRITPQITLADTTD